MARTRGATMRGRLTFTGLALSVLYDCAASSSSPSPAPAPAPAPAATTTKAKPHSDWDYVLPEEWSEKYPACGGRQQSPVDIVPHEAIKGPEEETLKDFVHYVPVSGAQVVNTGHGLQVTGAFGSITIMDQVYDVKQFHVHFPSEHSIDGEIHEGELHIVHQLRGSSGTDDLLVIGLLYTLGKENQFLKRLGLPDGAPHSADDAPYAVTGAIDLGHELEAELSGSFWHYDGSLTTPPCSETVKWFVLEKTEEVSHGQVEHFKELFKNPANRRPVQPLRGRVVIESSLLGCPREMGRDMTSRRLDGSAAGQPSWNYVVPQCWGSAYPECNGHAQSPIDINTANVSGKPGSATLLSAVAYSAQSGLKVKNTGSGLQVTGAFGTVSLHGVTYDAKQFHFHFPSEHTRDGEEYPGELHVVHQMTGSTGTDDLLVIGVLLELGPDNTFLQSLGLPAGAPAYGAADMSIAGSINLRTELANPLAGTFFHYQGSLTTPPCSETVQWFVLDQTLKVSQAQVDAFEHIVGSVPKNNRPIQLRNGRPLVKGRTSTDGIKAGSVGCEAEEEWSYLEPECWAAHYPACGGRAQSPVNIHSAGPFAADGGEHGFDIHEEAAYMPVTGQKVSNTGHALELGGSSFGQLTIEEHGYVAKTLVLHCPAEHAIDGREHACELQIQHQGPGGDMELIVAVHYEIGAEDPFLKKWGLPNGPPSAGHSLTVAGAVDLKAEFGDLLEKHFYRYDGSLTTPPCTEDVQWFVLNQTLTVSAAQVAAFKSLFPDPANNRPVQLLNGRGIFVNTLPGCYLESSKRRLASPAAAWGYVLPVCWEMHYPDCAGHRQSPINIDRAEVHATTASSFSLSLNHGVLSGAKLGNTGHGLQVSYGTGYVVFNGDTYDTKQFHFHFPSEHAVDGELAEGELHVVHQKRGSANSDDLLVVGLRYKIGTDSGFLNRLGVTGSSSLPTNATAAAVSVAGDLRLDDELALPASYGFYTYKGSLTTPPCAETVTWVVLRASRTMSHEQLAAAKKLFPDPENNRPLQPLHDRTVYALVTSPGSASGAPWPAASLAAPAAAAALASLAGASASLEL